MRFYAEQKKMEQVCEALHQICGKLTGCQQELKEVDQNLDWEISQKALIGRCIQRTAENIAEYERILGAAEAALGQIVMLYYETEAGIMASFSKGALKNPRIEQWITDIDDPGTRELLQEYMDYARKIEEAYEKAPRRAKELYDKYRDEIIIASMAAAGSYHQNGKLYIDYEGNINDPRGAESVYYHETGHFIVGKEGWVDGTKMSSGFQSFDEAVKSDVGSYIAQIESEQREKLSGRYSGKQLEQMVEQETAAYLEKQLGGSNRHVLNGVSDMIDAASNGKYNITYGHGDGYWDANPTRQANEAFAHMYAADFINDTKETEFMKTHFPNAYREYENLKKSALNS